MVLFLHPDADLAFLEHHIRKGGIGGYGAEDIIDLLPRVVHRYSGGKRASVAIRRKMGAVTVGNI